MATYGGTIELKTTQHNRIESVVMLRTDFATHAVNFGNRSVKLPILRDKGGNRGKGKNRLSVRMPNRAAQAIPGDYLLFVVDKDGVPSIAKHVRLNPCGEVSCID